MTNEARLIEKAIRIAVDAHAGQVDKQGVPYILHPLRVMAAVQEKVGLKPDYLAVAVLHDVVEDCDYTSHDILLELEPIIGLSRAVRIITSLESVTKRDGHDNESYIDFVRRSMKDEIGRVVKLADVRDNLDRIPAKLDTKWWAKLHTKYTVAIAILTDNQKWLDDNRDLVAGMEI